ncbi:MAG TPA: rhomboid family intramembrane serine protease [Candidatus Omnitrophica bacterium]|mgnify:CR=1 FL=1|nr:rhomboid family intramembrane serine protease [Candidatus Omnitrophota bacterium]
MIPLRGEVPSKKFPVSAIFLIALNGIIFLYQHTSLNYEYLRDVLALIPVKIFFGRDPKFYLTLLTYMFLHAGWLHFVSNMLYLWVFGNSVEDILGHMGFIYFYLLSGVGAGLIHAAMNPASAMPTIGASGAISGILAAYLMLYPAAKIVTLIPLFIFWQVVKIPAYVFIGLWFIFQFFYGFSSLAAESNISDVAWFAHLGGFIVGILILPVFIFIKRINR